MDRVIKERFIVTRQLNLGTNNHYVDNISFLNGNVPGRVLDLIKAELLFQIPELEDTPQIDHIVRSICKRLARGEEFDFDESMEADKRWETGMFKVRKT